MSQGIFPPLILRENNNVKLHFLISQVVRQSRKNGEPLRQLLSHPVSQ